MLTEHEIYKASFDYLIDDTLFTFTLFAAPLAFILYEAAKFPNFSNRTKIIGITLASIFFLAALAQIFLLNALRLHLAGFISQNSSGSLKKIWSYEWTWGLKLPGAEGTAYSQTEFIMSFFFWVNTLTVPLAVIGYGLGLLFFGRRIWVKSNEKGREDQKQEPVAARCDETHLHVTLANGQIITTPLWWYPRLDGAAPEQRNVVELMAFGIHWPEIDEDLSIESMLKGWKARNAVRPDTATAAL